MIIIITRLNTSSSAESIMVRSTRVLTTFSRRPNKAYTSALASPSSLHMHQFALPHLDSASLPSLQMPCSSVAFPVPFPTSTAASTPPISEPVPSNSSFARIHTAHTPPPVFPPNAVNERVSGHGFALHLDPAAGHVQAYPSRLALHKSCGCTALAHKPGAQSRSADVTH
jgi:hypothetical protein